MTTVAIFSSELALAAAFRAAVAETGDLAVSGSFTDFALLEEHLRVERPDLALLEVRDSAAGTGLESLPPGAAVVLWVDALPVDVVRRALAAGARGILSMKASVELHLDCLRSVASGHLWLDRLYCESLLAARHVHLTGRQCQLVLRVSQGLTNKEIARSLSLTLGTVKVYLTHLFYKVGVCDRFELALFGIHSLFGDPTPAMESAWVSAASRGAARPPAARPLPGMVRRSALPGSVAEEVLPSLRNF